MTTAPPHRQPRLRLPGVASALGVTTGVGVGAAGLAALVAGAAQVRGALLGAVVVAGFFAMGSVATGVAAAYAPRLSLFVAVLTYALQVLLLGIVLVGVAGSGAAGTSLDTGWLGGTVIAGTLCWTAVLVTHALRGVDRPDAGHPSGEVVRR
jgi:ATP synthase protein I